MNLRQHKRRACAGMARRRAVIGGQFRHRSWYPILTWRLLAPWRGRRNLYKADCMFSRATPRKMISALWSGQ